MSERTYSDFDLVIEPAGRRRFRARVLNAAEGAAVEFGPLFDNPRLENLVLRMGLALSGAQLLIMAVKAVVLVLVVALRLTLV